MKYQHYRHIIKIMMILTSKMFSSDFISFLDMYVAIRDNSLCHRS